MLRSQNVLPTQAICTLVGFPVVGHVLADGRLFSPDERSTKGYHRSRLYGGASLFETTRDGSKDQVHTRYDEARARLLAAREQRTLTRDHKVLYEVDRLAFDALAKSAPLAGSERYRNAAKQLRDL